MKIWNGRENKNDCRFLNFGLILRRTREWAHSTTATTYWWETISPPSLLPWLAATTLIRLFQWTRRTRDTQEEDLYSREAKEQAAREMAEEAANSMELLQ